MLFGGWLFLKFETGFWLFLQIRETWWLFLKFTLIYLHKTLHYLYALNNYHNCEPACQSLAFTLKLQKLIIQYRSQEILKLSSELFAKVLGSNLRLVTLSSL